MHTHVNVCVVFVFVFCYGKDGAMKIVSPPLLISEASVMPSSLYGEVRSFLLNVIGEQKLYGCCLPRTA